MREKAVSLFQVVDSLFSRAYLNVAGDRNSLITLLLHGLFRNEDEISANHVNPQQRLTVSHLRRIIDYYLDHGYVAVSQDDILAGLDSSGKYFMLTFDDGYFSSNLAVPLLEEYGIPATFFISLNHVIQNKCFWWDVLWRERIKEGIPHDMIVREQEELKSLRNDEIESRMVSQFGESSLNPIGDIDRPLSVAEFQDLSKKKTVRIGNHTKDHAILTNYSVGDITEQINDSQRMIKELTDIDPIMISYPNGNYSQEIIRISQDAGLQLGITVEPRKNYLHNEVSGSAGMRIGRFIPIGDSKIEHQLALTRSDFTLRRALGR